MKQIIVLSILALSCSKEKDPSPVNPLLGDWKLMTEQISDCGANNPSASLGTMLTLTDSKLPSGNYSAYYQGNKLEYRANGDSIIFIGWKKGKYTLTNVLTISGKYTVVNQLTGCSFKDNLQRP